MVEPLKPIKSFKMQRIPPMIEAINAYKVAFFTVLFMVNSFYRQQRRNKRLQPDKKELQYS